MVLAFPGNRAHSDFHPQPPSPCDFCFSSLIYHIFFSHFLPSSHCCFLICIQISQEAGQVVWYSQLCQNFPQFIVIYTVKGFAIVNKTEIDVFLELSCFFDDLADVGN